MYTLSNLADQGHVYATKEQLIKTAAELLEAEEGCVVMTLDQMLADHDLILQKVEIPKEQRKHEMPADLEQPEWKLAEPQITEAIYLPPFYYAETGVAGKLKAAGSSGGGSSVDCTGDGERKTGNQDLSIDVEKIQEKVHMEYDEVQADAIRKAAVSKVMVLTGGPGTGKTTTTQGIIAAYRAFGLKILLAAPTGRAAKRMTEATGLKRKQSIVFWNVSLRKDISKTKKIRWKGTY